MEIVSSLKNSIPYKNMSIIADTLIINTPRSGYSQSGMSIHKMGILGVPSPHNSSQISIHSLCSCSSLSLSNSVVVSGRNLEYHF